MMKLNCTLGSLLLATTLGFAQPQPANIKPIAQNLKDALVKLQSNPKDPAAQARYLKAFPKRYKTFLAIFDTDGELYDGFEYILLLPSLAEHHVVEVGSLLIGLSKDAEYDADAPSYLQHATAEYGSRYADAFVKLLNQLPSIRRSHIVTFLADVENHSAYPEYQTIIDNLKSRGLSGLAKEFEVARMRRSRQPHG